MKTLSEKILALPCDHYEYATYNGGTAYQFGHKDARHAAASLAAEQDALVRELADALREISERAPAEKPDWINSDNHGDTASNAMEIEHFRLAQIARAALSKLNQPDSGE